MEAGLANGSVTQDQYDAWQREIIATEQELKNLEAQCRNTDYDEGMVRRLIERITVFEDRLSIEFKCGLETEVQM